MPFESPNHTQIPNDLFDVLLPQMGYAELKVTLAVLRKTLGWQKRADKISLSQLKNLTGLSRPAIVEGLEQAEQRGTLTRKEGYITEWTVNLLDHPESDMVKQVYRNGKVTLPEMVKQVYPQKKEKKTKESKPRKERAATELYPLALAISKVCHMDLEANRARLFKETKLLSKATPPPTPELIEQHYNGNPGAFWKAQDWRGKKGFKPTPAAIRETWGQWDAPRELSPLDQWALENGVDINA